MRLTKWRWFRTNKRLYRANNKISVSDLTWKLGQLEDIEEELGIDLITLWKAINNRIFIRTDCNYHFVGFGYLEQDSKGDWYWDTIDGNFYLKDYGKTWALTKEELE